MDAVHVDYMHNLLTVEGAPAPVARARSLLFTGPASRPIAFEPVLPPPDLDGDWHDNARKAWGCYEDPLGVAEAGGNPDRLVLTFLTPGGAPAGVMRALSAMVPETDVRLDSVWIGDPREMALSGTWRAGKGDMLKVEGTREHYARVLPGTQEWELDELFPEDAPAGP